MGIYIKSMDMPKDGKWFNGQLTITIFSNGDVIENVGILRPQLRIYGNVATEVPEPHGRLIDADSIEMEFEIRSYSLVDAINTRDRGIFLIGAKKIIRDAPTIIERSE